MPQPQNTFAVDYAKGENIVDLNNPKVPRYQFREYPKMMYHATHKAIAVASIAEEQKWAKAGYQLTPVAKQEPVEVPSDEEETEEIPVVEAPEGEPRQKRAYRRRTPKEAA